MVVSVFVFLCIFTDFKFFEYNKVVAFPNVESVGYLLSIRRYQNETDIPMFGIIGLLF